MSTSSHISLSFRSIRRRNSFASLSRRAVPYATEMLERRTLLFAELNLSPQPVEEEVATFEHYDFSARLAAHALTAAEMQEHAIASVEWEGRQIYARRNEWNVQLRRDAGRESDAQAVLDSLGFGPIFVEMLGSPDRAVARLPEGRSHADLVAALTSADAFGSVEPNVIGWVSATPNDTHYATQQWSMNNTGQASGGVTGYLDADVDAPEAWDLTSGSFGTVVGVIDTGVSYTHPDLYKNIWINQDEIPSGVETEIKNDTGWDVDSDGLITFRDLNDPVNQGPGEMSDLDSNGRIDGADILTSSASGGWANGSDEDNNSRTDDLIGWDFANNDNNPSDQHGTVGHGTHVAGIIAAEWNNSAGIAGIARNAQIMVLRASTTAGEFTASAVENAIDYATDMKSTGVNVRVTNNSYELDDDNSGVSTEIAQSRDAGILFVAAAGNGGGDAVSDSIESGASPQYPASYDYTNVITVAATDRTDALTSWSNYGYSLVDLGAPGEEIYSLSRTGGYTLLSGTSQAAPHVAGAVALISTFYPAATMADVRDSLLNTADVNAGLYGRTVSGGRLNARRAFDWMKGVWERPATSNADQVIVRLKSGDSTTVEVVVTTGGTPTTYPRTVASTGIIRLSTLDGDDTVSVSDANGTVTIPIWVDGGGGADSVTGGTAEDRLIGSTGNDTLSGGAGSDALVGDGGADSLTGGNDSDHLIGGADADIGYGSAGNDNLRGNEGDDDLNGDAGNDTYLFPYNDANLGTDYIDDESQSAGTGGTDTLDLSHYKWSGGSGSVNLSNAGTRLGGGSKTVDDSTRFGLWVRDKADVATTGNTALENLKGTDGTDTITGSSAGNLIWGQFGGDSISGGDGNDTVLGGNTEGDNGVGIDDARSNDFLFGEGGADSLSGGFRHDQLDGGGGNDTLNGDTGNDVLTGGTADDTMNGGLGDDMFFADTTYDGADVMNGNSGVDEAHYELRTANLALSIDGTANDGAAFGEYDNIKADIEKVSAGSGHDSITGGNGNETLSGGAGNDTIKGGYGNDDIDGQAGANTMYGEEPGHVTIVGGSYSDFIRGGTAQIENDTIYGGPGNDVLRGMEGDDDIYGEDGDDNIEGFNGADDIWGGNGNDDIDGGDGADNIRGEGGNDVLKPIQDGFVDTVDGGTGTDTCLAANRDDDPGGITDILSSVEVT